VLNGCILLCIVLKYQHSIDYCLLSMKKYGFITVQQKYTPLINMLWQTFLICRGQTCIFLFCVQ